MATKSDLAELLPAARAIAHSAEQLANHAAEELTTAHLEGLRALAGMLSQALAEFAKGCELAIKAAP